MGLLSLNKAALFFSGWVVLQGYIHSHNIRLGFWWILVACLLGFETRSQDQWLA